MEPSQYQLQIFVSLIVILGAALVALICDFLKSNNEQLRELTIELEARQEEQRRVLMPMARPMEPAAPVPAAKPAATVNLPREHSEKQADPPTVARVLAAPSERKRPPAREALAAMERGAMLAGAPRAAHAAAAVAAAGSAHHRESAPAAEAKMETAPVKTKPEVIPVPPTQPVVVTVTPEVVMAVKTVESNAGAKRDWISLLSRNAEAAKAVTPQPAEAEPSAMLPSGFHDGYILGQLVQSRQRVNGLVVSIGVNTTRKADGTNYNGIQKLIQSLIGDGDFACQSNEQEFLLIYPNERGASAQRRLNEIAQELWNFQLGSLGTRSIVFTWGGVEVRGEAITDAIASANERMQETRRGRKLLTMEPREDMALQEAV